MNSINSQLSTFTDSKSHYNILDGLRGVAAVLVVVFHIFETHATSHLDQIINHGYLAVDFFYVLSGFVIGYAYDDRWNKMTLADFLKRRLIRLHPMIVIGMIIGALGYYFQDCEYWPIINETPLWKMLLIMLIGFTLIPVPTSMDIRGWGEMHPLNGPAWSLFFEYIANLLYGFFIRKFSNKLLSFLVFIAGCALIHLAVTNSNGDVAGGWSLEPSQFRIGLTRLMYPFFSGLLLSRLAKLKQIKHGFLLCTLSIVVILSMPRIGGSQYLWINGLYDSLSIIFLFPLIVYIGASGRVEGKYATKICTFLGDISYPIYITHFPLIYIYAAWLKNYNISFQQSWPVALLLLFLSLAISFACLKVYDVPLRKWLANRFIKRSTI